MLSLCRVYYCGKTIRYQSPLGFTGAHADHRGKIITVITESSNFHSVFRDLLSLENIQAYIPKVDWFFLGLQPLL